MTAIWCAQSKCWSQNRVREKTWDWLIIGCSLIATDTFSKASPNLSERDLFFTLKKISLKQKWNKLFRRDVKPKDTKYYQQLIINHNSQSSNNRIWSYEQERLGKILHNMTTEDKSWEREDFRRRRLSSEVTTPYLEWRNNECRNSSSWDHHTNVLKLNPFITFKTSLNPHNVGRSSCLVY